MLSAPWERGCPPVKVVANGLPGGRVELKGSVSSQYLTAVLMAAPLSTGDIEIVITDELISKPYIDMTVKLMERFGVEVQVFDDMQRFVVKGGQTYQSPGEAFVEGDASSASYFPAGAAITGGKVKVIGCGTDSLQGDTKFADTMGLMGAKVEWGKNDVTVTGPGGKLKAIDVNMNAMPDAAMTLAVAALYADGVTTIRDVGSWRVKETERMIAICTEMRKLDATCTRVLTTASSLPQGAARSTRVSPSIPTTITVWPWHSRSPRGGVGVTIMDPTCTKKTFPTYFDALATVTV